MYDRGAFQTVPISYICSQVIATTTWSDSTGAADVATLQQDFAKQMIPILARMTGEPDSASYSNEANIYEPDFQTTFYGPKYSRLSAIKATYDPTDLFVVRTGVGSERWDDEGMCTVG